MKKFFQLCVAGILLGSLTISADPLLDWNWTPPTTYVNGVPIPATDNLGYTLKCGVLDGGPYDVFETQLNKPPPDLDVDMAPLVNNQPGEYFCIATASSSEHLTESGPSNQINFTVLPTDLGLVPNPPVLSLQ